MRIDTGLQVVLATAIALAVPTSVRAEHFEQRTQERRTVLYYHVPETVLGTLLPAGWQPLLFDAGPAKGANLTVNFSEQISAIDAKGLRAADSRGRAITISARVRDPVSGEGRSMVMFGLTTGPDVPGPYGRHRKGDLKLERIERADGRAAGHIDERWDATSTEGDGLHVNLAWDQGAIVASHVEQQTRSSRDPSFFRIYKVDLLSEVIESVSGTVVPTGPIAVTFQGEPAKYLAGATRVAVVSVPVYDRAIWLPDDATPR